MGYFIQRESTVKGPFSQAKLKTLVQEKKLRKNDAISDSVDGPWEPLATAYNRIFGFPQNATQPTIPAINEWTVNRGLFGNYKIEFACPKCNADLRSEEGDIGQRDYCPQCGVYFVLHSSVAEEIAADREQRSIKKQAAADEKQRKRDEKQRLCEEQKWQRDELRRQREREAEMQIATAQVDEFVEHDNEHIYELADLELEWSVPRHVGAAAHVKAASRPRCWYCGCVRQMPKQCEYCRMLPVY